MGKFMLERKAIKPFPFRAGEDEWTVRALYVNADTNAPVYYYADMKFCDGGVSTTGISPEKIDPTMVEFEKGDNDGKA